MTKFVWANAINVIVGASLLFVVSITLGEDLTTISGVTYKGISSSRIEPDGINVVHSGGVAKIEFRDLPPDLQKKYGYDPNAAAAYATATAKAQQDAARARLESARKLEVKKRMEEIEAAGLLSRVQIRQVTADGILGDAECLTTETVSETVQVAGTALDTVPRTAVVKREYSSWKSLGYIFIPGEGAGLADGENWKGKLWPAGTYRYTTVQGATKTVRQYAASAQEAVTILQASPTGAAE